MKISIINADFNDPQHAQDILFLLNEYALDVMGGGQPLDHYVRENLINEFKKRPTIFSIICYVNNKPAGLVNAIMGFSTFKCKPLLNIHDLAVIKAFRGLGISQKLLAAVEDIARAEDCCKITLEVLEGNTIARNAYQRFGFKPYELDPTMGSALLWQKNL